MCPLIDLQFQTIEMSWCSSTLERKCFRETTSKLRTSLTRQLQWELKKHEILYVYQIRNELGGNHPHTHTHTIKAKDTNQLLAILLKTTYVNHSRL